MCRYIVVVVVVGGGITACSDLCTFVIFNVYKTKITSPTRGARLFEMRVSPKPNTAFQNMLPLQAKRTFVHVTFSKTRIVLL